ncbi:MAG: hypothetical protein J3Q66DRAFT_436522 [Benniella sp.]|nr:MAG: hypothetical protein J3Q66DRAFT_436522 [Benniella sp.]
MDTHAKLQNTELVAEGGQMSNFFRQYGWSISSLNTMIKFNDHLATLLDDSTKIHSSRLTRLILLPENLTTDGLKAIDRVIKRSPTLNYLWLFISGLHQESQLEKAVHLLGLCGRKLCRLAIMGENIEGWLPQLAKAFPDRNDFPVMSKLEVRCYSKRELPQECVKWLAVMASTPSSLGTHLDYLQIHNAAIQPQDWVTLIKAIDFSRLEDLRFDSTNFSQEQLGILIDSIAVTDATLVPLNNLNITAFRVRNSSKVITIPTRHDPTSNQRVVCWKDIQQYFENARGVFKGNDAVLFLTDDDLEYLIPHRIAHHPNVILEVLATETLESTSRRIGFGNMVSMLRDVASLRITETGHHNSALVLHAQDQSSEAHQTALDNTEPSEPAKGSTVPRSPSHSDSMYSYQSLALPQEEILRLVQRTLDRQHLIQYRVQTLLSTPLENPQVPPFFFILPKDPDSDSDNKLRRPESRLFQLHFLCGCSSHTMTKGARRVHQVHMTNHLGYDIKSPKEFFDKYGSYALTMMYMVRYGAISSGFVVPPLAQSNIATTMEQNHDHPIFVKENIGHLVDDTIAYLEDVTRAFDSDTVATSQWITGPPDLAELKSYLDTNDEHFPGRLHQLTIQEEHSPWVCGEHRLEWTMQYLKDIVNSIGGFYTEKQRHIDIAVASDKAAEQFYTAIVAVFKVRNDRSGILLTMNHGRLSLKIDDSQEGQSVSMTITRLSDLTSDDLEFIHQCNITQLKVKHTPTKPDEARLLSILNQSTRLRELDVGCHCERTLSIFDLVIAEREKVLQNGGSSELHIFKVTDEEGPIDFFRWKYLDKADHITITVTFSEESTTVDMDTHAKLQNRELTTERSLMFNFFRQYGWSISTLNTLDKFNDRLATLLDDVTRFHGSRLTRLILMPEKLTMPGLEALDRVIKRSPRLEYIWLYFWDLQQDSQLEKAMRLLGLYGEKMRGVYFYSKQKLPQACVKWLAGMVSNPSSLGAHQRYFQLHNAILQPQDWETLIKAIDFSKLEELKFDWTNFSEEQLDVLIDRIAATDAALVSLNSLDLAYTDLLVIANADKQAVQERIQKVAPQAFRARYSSEVITIPTRHDPRSGQRVVRWKDIQQYFENAKGIFNGKTAVLFLTDDELEDLIPHRIAYHPDVILEVLVTDNSQSFLSATETTGSILTSGDVASLRITEPGRHNYALVAHVQSQSPEAQAVPHLSGQTNNMCSHRSNALPQPSELNTNQLTHGHPPRLQLEMDYIASVQGRLEQLEQKTERMQHQIVEISQEAQQTRQQVDDVPGKIQHSEQQIQRQIDDILQRVQQLQVCMNGTDHVNHSPVDHIREQVLERLQDTLNCQRFIHYRVHTLLSTLSDDLMVPQLFLILPRDPGLDNQQSHKGYDIKRPKEFFASYGSYALTVMYLVKYGAIGSGFALPPLAQSNLMTRIEENLERLGFIKESVGQLMDDTIAYLEGTTRAYERDTVTASQWGHSPTVLEELRSYLDIDEGEHFPGDVHRLTTQKGHCSLMCSEHHLEWVMQRLKDIINSIGGSYTEKQRDISIEVASDQAVKKLYSAILDVFKVQSNSDVSLLTMDCGRLSFKFDMAREAQNVSMAITRLSDLTPDDLEFIQQCNISQLEIKHTPTEPDEDRLTNILHQSVKLKELEIMCHCERTLAIIDLVLIVREKILQSGRSSALHIFKVADESGPIDIHSWTVSEKDAHIATTVTFSEDSTTFSMDTHIKLKHGELFDEGGRISNFIRQYGWSISMLNTMRAIDDHLATLLNDTTRIHGSRLTRLVLVPSRLTAGGLDTMDQVIKRSSKLDYLELSISSLHKEFRLEKAVRLLGFWGKKLNALYVMGENIERWLPQLAKVFPDRNSFPMMREFEVRCTSKREFPRECVKWLAVMVSTHFQSSPLVTRLDFFRLCGVTLQPQDWVTLIKAIDFSTLRNLYLNSTNFSQEQLDILIECIGATDVTPLPLNTLKLAAFRVRNSSEVVTIPTRHDPMSNQRVVCWKDIQQYFENARGVFNGNDAVLFLTDDDLEYLIPHRIAHHPSVILEVLVTETLESTSRRIGFGNVVSMLRDVASLRITETGHHNGALVLHAQDHSSEAHQTALDNTEPSEPTKGFISSNPLSHLLEFTQRYPLLGPIGVLILSIFLCHLFFYPRSTVPRSPSHSDSMYSYQSLALPQEEILQLVRRTLDRQHLIQYRVQTLLSTPLENPQVPPFFFILPKDPDSDSDNKLRRPESRLFQLHFLCGCSSHTMTKGARRVHQVHMTNHLGYDIKSPKEFFDKYGSYALTMMYMVRYGAISSEFVVPPLAHSNIATTIEQNHDHPSFIKENIGHLVDDTIAYLEDVTRAFDSDTDATSQWIVGPPDLGELKSYLDTNDEHFPGRLHQLTTQEEYSPWVCGEHRLEWTMQRLKDIVNSIGGFFTEKRRHIDIAVASDKAAEQFYTAIVAVFKTQNDRSGILLTMNHGRLSLKIDDSQEGQSVSMTITRLGDLTSDDLEFIHQCNITQLKVKHTPTKPDEARLLSILNQSARLRELEVGCHCERTLAIIDLAISEREKILQAGSSALHIFKVTDEVGPIDFYRWIYFEKDDHITTTVTFSEESTTFDMDTHAKLQSKEPVREGSRMFNFFRQYGWSISILNTLDNFDDHLATLLDDVTRIHGSRLKRLILLPEKLTTHGLDAMDRVIKRSSKLDYIWLYFWGLQQDSQLEKAMRLLGLYGEKLNRLSLIGYNLEGWLPQLANAFPTKDDFPMISEFEVRCSNQKLPQMGVKWLADMVSTQSLSGVHLKYFRLCGAIVQPQDWETLIKAIDFSKLEELRFDSTNFSQEQFNVLIDCIAEVDPTLLQLNNLDLSDTDLLVNADNHSLRERIQKVAPQVSIVGLS